MRGFPALLFPAAGEHELHFNLDRPARIADIAPDVLAHGAAGLLGKRHIGLPGRAPALLKLLEVRFKLANLPPCGTRFRLWFFRGVPIVTCRRTGIATQPRMPLISPAACRTVSFSCSPAVRRHCRHSLLGGIINTSGYDFRKGEVLTAI
jgi:hypothetical protein